jgi:sec-independent protein translocase protein TatA
MIPLVGMFTLSPMEIAIILGLGLLLFGRKLPEVGRYLGKGIVEFKKGIKGMEDDLDTNIAQRTDSLHSAPPPPPPQRVMPSVPKFEDNAGSFTTPPKA